MPGCSRTGTRKSRAPSGVDRVSVGVSISLKSCACSTSRAIWLARERSLSAARRAGAAQVEVAVAQPQVVAGVDVVVDRDRQRGRLGEHAQLGDGDLDLAGGQVRVLVAGRSPGHLAGDVDAELVAQRVRLVGLSEHDLHHARASRRSTKVTPPWSRRRATQPARVTVAPAWEARRVPAS